MTQQSKPKTLTVEVGGTYRDFAAGDYLNAIDAVTCYFISERETSDIDLAASLRQYAAYLERLAGIEVKA